MAEGTDTVKCPVCHTEIGAGSRVCKLYGAVRTAPRATSTHEGKEFFFCCKACKKTFDASSEKYVKK